MIVYVESNFVLEQVFAQEQSSSVDRIIQMAIEGVISIRFPDIAVYEPMSTVVFRQLERSNMIQTVQAHQLQLRRSGHFPTVNTLVGDLATEFGKAAQAEDDRLTDLLETMLRVGIPLHVNHTSLLDALNYKATYGMTLKDSLVYALVATDLDVRSDTEPSCFVSRDAKAFGHSDITQHFRRSGCRTIYRFDQATQFLENELKGMT